MMLLRAKDRLFRMNIESTPKPPPRWVKVQEAYREAGLSLLREIENSGTSSLADVYPALFLCRHAVELELKAALAMSYVADHAPNLDKKIDQMFKTHDLMKLWELFAACSQMVALEEHARADGIAAKIRSIKPLIDNFRTCIADFCKVDPSSMTFRYPVDKTYQSTNLSGLSLRNFINVYNRMSRTLCLFRLTMEDIIKLRSDPDAEYETSLTWLDRFENERWATEQRETEALVELEGRMMS
jgi:hypothetical protein